MLKKIIIASASVFIAACGSIEPRKDTAGPISMTSAVITQLGDAKYWVVVRPITYTTKDRDAGTTKSLQVPKGFVTDLASVPREFWAALSPTDKYMNAAILHDYLYWDQRCGKTDADVILYAAMRSYGVSSNQRHAVFDGVYFGGHGSYEENHKRREQGESRFLAADYVDSLLDRLMNSSITWNDVKKEAQNSNNLISDTSNPDIDAFCAIGSNRAYKE